MRLPLLRPGHRSADFAISVCMNIEISEITKARSAKFDDNMSWLGTQC